ncbi:MAG: peptidase [Proteobacteria bacterium]|nr:peptidase [Pseudomonadota bacterium]
MKPLHSLFAGLKITPFLPQKPWQIALFAITGMFVLGAFLAATVALVLTPTLPSLEDLSGDHLKVPLRIYTSEGTLLAEFGEERRIPIKVADVPPQLIQAILSAEDDAFYYHQGVDFQGILRAAINNLRRGRTSEGASTITMQVARNYFLSPEKTYARKIKEVLLAFKIEREFSKSQILELYLNKIFLGSRAYGFAAAAQIYFGKNLNELALPEMALLAGLPKAPSRYNPIANPESALERRSYVLRRMLKLGLINEATFTESMNAPLGASRHALRFSVDAPYVAEMVRQIIVEKYTESSYADGYHIYTTIRDKDQQAADAALRKALLAYDRRHGWRGPAGQERINRKTEASRLDELLKDYPSVGNLIPAIITQTDEKLAIAYTQDGTSIDLGLPAVAWAAHYIDEDTLGPSPKRVTDVLRVGDVIYLEHVNEDEWKLAQVPDVEGGFVALDPKNGAILALGGGFDFRHNQYNHVALAQRLPGSSFKPFIYSAALEKGFTPASLISGAPIVVEDVSLEDEWRPEDYSRKFFGPTRLRKALALSLNLVSVRLLRAITPEYAAEYMGRFGFNPEKLPKNLSLTLGTADATPLQMAEAFAVFANGGYRIQNHLIQRIEDAKHNILEQANPIVVCPGCPAPKSSDPAIPAPRYAEQVITAQNSFLMNSILRDTISYGTAQAANVLNRKDLAGKTGTTNDHRDAWFNGFNSDLVAISWVGFDQNQPLGKGETGGRAALPMWIDYMRVVLEDTPEKPLVPPPGIVATHINRDTGKPTAPSDPNAMLEYFMEGTVETGTDVLEGGTAPAPEGVREGLF